MNSKRLFFRVMVRCSRSRLKWPLLLTLIYVLNLLIGIDKYLFLERSFDQYKSSMLKIDIDHPQSMFDKQRLTIENKFRIENGGICLDKSGKTDSKVRLLIFVKSAVENVRSRQSIRQTWASRSALEANSVAVAFLLGLTEKSDRVDLESNLYNDIVQIDKTDNYYNNSYKMLMMLRWIQRFCSSNSTDDLRRYVLFIDDDYFLDLSRLLLYLDGVDTDETLTERDRQRFVTGYLYNDSRPRRLLTDRWFISLEDYPYNRYPPYVTAGCFLMSRPASSLFDLAARYIPVFRFDDIYLGLLAYSMSIRFVANNDLFSSYGSLFTLSRPFDDQSYLKKIFYLFGGDSRSTVKQPICVHGYRDEELIDLWNRIHSSNVSLKLWTEDF